jgi:hypothetical protein
MKTLLIFLLIPLFSFSQMIEKDKQMHLLAGASFGGLAYEIAVQENVHTLLPTVGLATFMGAVKETIDWQTHGTFDALDLAYTSLGGLAMWAILELFGRKSGHGMFGASITGIGLFMIIQ